MQIRQPSDRVILEVRTSRTSEETPEAMVQLLASLTNLKTPFLYLWRRGVPVTLEVAQIDQQIKFFVSVPSAYQTFMESQIVSQYPKALLTRVPDYLPKILENDATLSLSQIKLAHSHIYPLKTLADFKDVDPMSSLLGALSKSQPGDITAVQFLILPVNNSWQASGHRAISAKQTTSDGKSQSNPYSSVITEKISHNGFKVAIRLAANAPTKERSWHVLTELATSFASFNNPSGNSLIMRRPILWQRSRLKAELLERSKHFVPSSQILNVRELATMFHFPTLKLSTIPNIAWYKTILSEAPENLPIAEGLDDDQKKGINFFARTIYKNRMTTFGIKRVDRRRHVYVIGKSGTGKSTFIANMAINDMRNGEGFCVIDPHGDLCEHILQYIPSYRVNDLVYLDPSDPTRSFAINPLEVTEDNQKELVASGIVAIFKKLYGESWGPRLEYILRNTVVSVMEMPDATLLMLPEMLANSGFRAKVVERIKDPILKSFWVNEFDRMTDRLRVEAISPIQNKVGQFTSSQRIRNIIGHPKSSIDIEKVMNEGKILILNLSQGYLGEDNAALLGAMIITKVQLAAMNRVSIPEEQRKDFFLYVDEFQNFATTSFIKILSEARKFRLCLILANQYIAQIPEDVRAAIFGNAGTLMSFLVGATDAGVLAKEYSERFKEEDLLALGNYQAILKLYIDGITQSPFHCYTLPLPKSSTQNADKVKRISRERYTKDITDVVGPAGLFENAPPAPAFGGGGGSKWKKPASAVPKPTGAPVVSAVSRPKADQPLAEGGEETKKVEEVTVDKESVIGSQSSVVGSKSAGSPVTQTGRPKTEKPVSENREPRTENRSLEMSKSQPVVIGQNQVSQVQQSRPIQQEVKPQLNQTQQNASQTGLRQESIVRPQAVPSRPGQTPTQSGQNQKSNQQRPSGHNQQRSGFGNRNRGQQKPGGNQPMRQQNQPKQQPSVQSSKPMSQPVASGAPKPMEPQKPHLPQSGEFVITPKK